MFVFYAIYCLFQKEFCQNPIPKLKKADSVHVAVGVHVALAHRISVLFKHYLPDLIPFFYGCGYAIIKLYTIAYPRRVALARNDGKSIVFYRNATL